MNVYYNQLDNQIYLVMRLFGPYGNYEARNYGHLDSMGEHYISITFLIIPPYFYLLGEL